MGPVWHNLQKAYKIEAVKITGVAPNERVYLDSKSPWREDPAQDPTYSNVPPTEEPQFWPRSVDQVYWGWLATAKITKLSRIYLLG